MANDGDIVGLKGTRNGRSCESHDCCGDLTSPDDLVRFKLTVVDIDGKTEEAIKVVRVSDGTESCMVEFYHVISSKVEKKSLLGNLLK